MNQASMAATTVLTSWMTSVQKTGSFSFSCAPRRHASGMCELPPRSTQRIGAPEIARAITSRWISEVPSKIV